MGRRIRAFRGVSNKYRENGSQFRNIQEQIIRTVCIRSASRVNGFHALHRIALKLHSGGVELRILADHL